MTDPAPLAGHVAPINPPAMLGVLGGGQFGRFFVLAARQMGYQVTVLDPDPLSPAGALANTHLIAEYDDTSALETLASTCAAVTVDFENPPVESLKFLADHTVVRPSPEAVAICQDRILEKAFLKEIGANVAPYRVITTPDDLAAAADLTYPAILKPARFGLDGKGQKRVMKFDDLADAWANLGNVPCVLEHRLTLDREISMMVVRSTNNRVATYPLAQNHLIEGVLDTTYVPAWMPEGAADAAAQLCTYIARELDFVGVLCIELFISGYDVFVNELAPHPHTAGLYTLDFANTSQFEQQVRALCGQGLGDTTLTTQGAATVGLLGETWEHGEPMWHGLFGSTAAHLHLYGKAEPLPGVPMGHISVGSDTALGATNLARRLRKLVKIDSPPVESSST